MLDGSRSSFPAEIVDAELVARAERMDVHPSGPMVGLDGPAPSGEVAELERGVLEAHAELVRGLERFGLSGERRPLRMRVLDLEWCWTGDDALTLAFGLRAGCYATSVLREVLDYTDASHDLNTA